MIQEYHKYHTDRDNTRIGLFTVLKSSFQIQKVLYAGSYTHITPSLVFSEVVYVDSDMKFDKFFKDSEVLNFINSNKQYSQPTTIKSYKSDYAKDFGESENSFDLLLSQYAGFISKYCYKYLKPNGILVANNSHGDADWARLSNLYEFIGVYNRIDDCKYKISFDNLDTYFIAKKEQEITLENIEKKQSGYGYTKSPSGYIFRKK